VRHRALWSLLLLGLIAFAALAALYDHDPLAALDQEVAERVAAELPTAGEWAARPFSWIGGVIGITALCVVVAFVLVRERAWLDLAFFVAAVLGSQLVVALLKASFDRPRPDAGSAIELPSSAAFPSGHAAAGVAAFGAAAVLAAERLPGRRERTWLWASVVALGLAIGLSRVLLNVHYVTDVVAGWCFGLAWLAACLLLRDHVAARLGGRRRQARLP
jgi:undecaprenyl-diphosphatase